MKIKLVFEMEENNREEAEKISKILKDACEGIDGEVKQELKTEKVTPKKIETPIVEVANPIEEVKEKPIEIPAAAVPEYSDDTLVRYCCEASRLGLGSKIKDLIRGKYEVMKVSEIPQNQREDFIKDLRELGVRV